MAYLSKKMNPVSFYTSDPWLKPYIGIIDKRIEKCLSKENHLIGKGSFCDFAMGHFYYGLHRNNDCWVLREWAPNAKCIFINGVFSAWQDKQEFMMKRVNPKGDWGDNPSFGSAETRRPFQTIKVWEGGKGERIPSYANRVVQDDKTKIFSAQVWQPKEEYKWNIIDFKAPETAPVIYEAHIGMSSQLEKIATYREFTENILPIIIKSGYNTIQLMAIQEHPFYGSFGYHVSSFFSASSRFGTPEDLKELVDKAHIAGLRVIMDLVHSHSVKNINEGLGLFDRSAGQYFHSNERRNHVAWDSLCFDYGKDNVLHFLLSNCRYWLEEYKFDGFRFDGITSMIYFDHGLGKNFTSYDDYFDGKQDEDALVLLFLANKLIHKYKPGGLTIAEEMSGMPGLAADTEIKGYGFDYRLSMGVPDF